MWLTNLKIVAVTLAVVLFYTAMAHIIPQLESALPEAVELGGDVTPEQLAAAGEEIYNGAGNCASCHALGTRAPNLLIDYDGQGPIGSRCDAAFGAGCKDYLYSSLTAPNDSVVPEFAAIMPDMRRQLPGENEIWVLVAFLQSLGGEITVTAGDLEAGGAEGAGGTGRVGGHTATMDPRAILEEKGCLACHQIDGAGPPIGPSFDDVGGRLTADEIRQSVLDPNAEISEGFEQFAGVMPATLGQQLSAAQLEAIVQFLAARK